MKLGIKVGLRGHPFADIDEACPEFCEIWFHSGKIEDYDQLFAYLHAHKLEIGIHFWGALEDGTLANLGYPNKKILQQSLKLVQKTIDTAAKHKAAYVNIHPSGLRLTRVDFEQEEFAPLPGSVSASQSVEIFTESIIQISSYAENVGVPICLESVPRLALGRPWHGKNSRINPLEISEMRLAHIEHLFGKIANLYFANDFGHTVGGIESSDRSYLKSELFHIARRLIPFTKLLHVSYIIPPYNGTDYHGCLYYDEFTSTEAVPNRSEMIELLSVYKSFPVFALVEPETNHPRNLRILKALVSRD
ncbi:TIM barrel protein [Candidatus Gottesmanbacteria bacterium]|nr:TIM barrel protein [Candidatus Gottesmanbacteria bacterium]